MDVQIYDHSNLADSVAASNGWNGGVAICPTVPCCVQLDECRWPRTVEADAKFAFVLRRPGRQNVVDLRHLVLGAHDPILTTQRTIASTFLDSHRREEGSGLKKRKQFRYAFVEEERSGIQLKAEATVPSFSFSSRWCAEEPVALGAPRSRP